MALASVAGFNWLSDRLSKNLTPSSDNLGRIFASTGGLQVQKREVSRSQETGHIAVRIAQPVLGFQADPATGHADLPPPPSEPPHLREQKKHHKSGLSDLSVGCPLYLPFFRDTKIGTIQRVCLLFEPQNGCRSSFCSL